MKIIIKERKQNIEKIDEIFGFRKKSKKPVEEEGIKETPTSETVLAPALSNPSLIKIKGMPAVYTVIAISDQVYDMRTAMRGRAGVEDLNNTLKNNPTLLKQSGLKNYNLSQMFSLAISRDNFDIWRDLISFEKAKKVDLRTAFVIAEKMKAPKRMSAAQKIGNFIKDEEQSPEEKRKKLIAIITGKMEGMEPDEADEARKLKPVFLKILKGEYGESGANALKRELEKILGGADKAEELLATLKTPASPAPGAVPVPVKEARSYGEMPSYVMHIIPLKDYDKTWTLRGGAAEPVPYEDDIELEEPVPTYEIDLDAVYKIVMNRFKFKGEDALDLAYQTALFLNALKDPRWRVKDSDFQFVNAIDVTDLERRGAKTLGTEKKWQLYEKIYIDHAINKYSQAFKGQPSPIANARFRPVKMAIIMYLQQKYPEDFPEATGKENVRKAFVDMEKFRKAFAKPKTTKSGGPKGEEDTPAAVDDEDKGKEEEEEEDDEETPAAVDDEEKDEDKADKAKQNLDIAIEKGDDEGILAWANKWMRWNPLTGPFIGFGNGYEFFKKNPDMPIVKRALGAVIMMTGTTIDAFTFDQLPDDAFDRIAEGEYVEGVKEIIEAEYSTFMRFASACELISPIVCNPIVWGSISLALVALVAGPSAAAALAATVATGGVAAAPAAAGVVAAGGTTVLVMASIPTVVCSMSELSKILPKELTMETVSKFKDDEFFKAGYTVDTSKMEIEVLVDKHWKQLDEGYGMRGKDIVAAAEATPGDRINYKKYLLGLQALKARGEVLKNIVKKATEYATKRAERKSAETAETAPPAAAEVSLQEWKNDMVFDRLTKLWTK